MPANYETPMSAEEYLDFYKKYRGPDYQWKWDTPKTDTATTKPTTPTQPTASNSGSSSFSGSSGGGYSGGQTSGGGFFGSDANGWGGINGTQAITGGGSGLPPMFGTLVDAGSGALGSMLVGGLLGGTLGPIGSIIGSQIGKQAGKKITGLLSQDSSNNIVNQMAAEEGSTGRQFGATNYGLTPVAIAMAQMDAQAAENDANRVSGGSSSSSPPSWGFSTGAGSGFNSANWGNSSSSSSSSYSPSYSYSNPASSYGSW